MSGIVLSSSVRQNLLSLQSTADLLAQTQNRLATGNKVNSALDNPTNYFTSQSLNNRASDISNLLDGVSNGVQVLQAANTGITSLQKLIDSAKSVANQALQATSGYSTKSQVVSTTISGATASNLLGTASYSDVAATAGSAVQNNTTGAAYNNSVSGTQVFDDSVPGTFDGSTLGATTTTAATITGASDVSGALNAQFLDGQSFSITAGGSTKTFHFDGSGTPPADTSTDFYLDVSTATATGTDLKNAINTAFGASLTAAVDGTTGKLSLTAGDLTSSITVNPGTTSGLGFVGASVTAAPTTTASNLNATYTGNVDVSGALSALTPTDGHTFSITLGGVSKTFEFDNNSAVTSGNVAVDYSGAGTGTTLANTINTAFGSNIASVDGTTGFLKLSSATSTISTTQGNGGALIGLASGTNSYTTENTLLSGLTSNTAGSISGVTAGDSFTVNGKTVSFVSSGTTSVNALTGGVINSATGTVADFVNAINTITGGSVASVVNGKIHLDATQAPTGINVSLANGTGTPLAAFGLGTGVSVANTGAATSSTGITATSLLSDAGAGITAGPTTSGLHTAIASTDTLTVNGTVINFDGTSGGTTKNGSGYHIDLSVASVGDLLNTIDKITGTFGTANASTVSGGKINLSTGAQNLVISDSSGTSQTVLGKLGLGGLGTVNATTGAETISANSLNASPVTGATLLSQAAGPTSNGLQTAFTIGDTLSVNGKSITFSSSAATSTDSTGGVINLATGSVQDVLDAIDKVTGTFGTANASTITGGAITLHTGTTSDLTTSGSALAKLGLSASSTTTTRQANSTLSGLELKIASTDGGTASDITFGTGANQVNTLDELNTALAANNLSASLDTTGKLTITTTNDHNAATIGAISGSAVTQAGSPFASATVAGPVADTNSQNTRANLVSQYNNIIAQIQTTAQDSSYNGVNLLNGDQLKLVFNETGKSTLNIQGVTDDPTGLGLSNLASGTDFLDNSSTNKVLDTLNTASSTLRSQASTLGSNLSIVQIRQDFSKNLINVLQTGASSLTLADTNEEAANSQALSTRQSIAVSALALANTSQQSVLRLLQ